MYIPVADVTPGLEERFMITRNHLKCYNNVTVSANYHIPRSLLRSPDITGVQHLLAGILADVVCKQPIMGVAIQDEGTPVPQWRRLETINVHEVMRLTEVEDSTSLGKWIHKEHATAFTDNCAKPLWRLSAIASGIKGAASNDSTEFSLAICFVFHHAIGDGLSGAAFHLTFLDCLNHYILKQATMSRLSDGIIRLPAQDLPVSIEEATPLPLTIWFILIILFREFVYTPANTYSWSGPEISSTAPSTSSPSSHCTFSLNPETTKALLASCRRKTTTLTALLNVLVAQKLSLMHPSFTTFKSDTPISLRRFCPKLNSRTMGCFVSDISMSFSSAPNPARGQISCSSTDDTAMWESARKARTELLNKTLSPANQSVGMLKFVKNNFAGHFLGKLGQRRESAFEISNIGAINGGLHAELVGFEKEEEESGRQGLEKAVFDKLVFSAAPSFFACPYVFNVASVKGGELCVSLNWLDHVVVAEEAWDMMEWLEMVLRKIAAA